MSRIQKQWFRWAIKWRRTNQLDGQREWLEGDGEGGTKLFPTRRETRLFLQSRYGYIATRKDLRREPHCWRVPRAVRVRVSISEIKVTP